MKAIDWILQPALWLAGIVEKVTLWGLSLWAYVMGLLCMGLVLILHWVALTISNEVSGRNASVLGFSQNHHNSLLSWGVVAALLFAVTAWSYSGKHWRLLGLAGGILLLVSLGGLLQVAYGSPAFLKQLADEEKDWTMVQGFQNRFLPTTLRAEESNSGGPKLTGSIDTVWDRLVAARYFMGMGWYLTVVVGLCAFFYALPRMARIDRSRLSKGVVFMAALLAISFITRAVAAHILVEWGQVAEARGEPEKAIERYRRAMRLDRWFEIHTTLYQRIGAIDANYGRLETVDYGIYLSELLFSQGNFVEAIAELQKTTLKSGKLASVLQQREADMWASYGSTLYNQHAIASAIPAWHSALALDSNNWIAGFGMARAYFEVGRYGESADLTRALLKKVRDPVLIAELDSDLGDDLARLGDIGAAHVAYRQSYLIDIVYNWRALSDIVGAQSYISLEDSDSDITPATKP